MLQLRLCMRRPTHCAAALLVLCSLLASIPAAAQTRYTWNGGTFGWDEPARWTPNGVPAAQDTAVILNGTARLDTSTTVAGLTIGVAGMVSGDADLTVTANLTWRGGQNGVVSFQGNGTVVVAPEATLHMTGEQLRYTIAGNRVFINEGVGTWEGSTGSWDGGPFVNRGELTFAVDTETSRTLCFDSRLDSFTNEPGGLMRRTGTGAVRLLCGFNNDGIVLIEQGELDLAGFNNVGGTDTGRYEISDGATLTLGGGFRTMTSSASVSGPGSVEVWGGTATIDGIYDVKTTRATAGTINLGAPSAISTLELTGGIMGGSGEVTIAESFTWTAGSLTGTGVTVVAPGATLSIEGSTTKRLSEARILRHEGSGTWSGVLSTLGGSTYALHNAGSLEITDGANGSFIEILNMGRLAKTGTATVTLNNLRFINDGAVLVDGGTLTVNGCCIANAEVTDTGTLTVSENAEIVFSGVRTFAPGAVLEGTGRIRFQSLSLENHATMRPGFSPGTLTIDGNLPAPQPDAVLEIELAGYEPGTEHDVLAVTGSAVLGGRLRVSLLDGFMPAEGDRFNIVTATPIMGGFSEIESPDGLQAHVEVADTVAVLVIGQPVGSRAEEALTGTFGLRPSYPNPFHDATTIGYDVAHAGHVRISVYDLLGREVTVLVDQVHGPGRYEVVFDPGGLGSGVYLTRLVSASGLSQTQRLSLVR